MQPGAPQWRHSRWRSGSFPAARPRIARFPITRPGRATLETGFPLGGNALLFHSTELRFPLIGDNVGGVLFHDIGNVYSDIDDIASASASRTSRISTTR